MELSHRKLVLTTLTCLAMLIANLSYGASSVLLTFDVEQVGDKEKLKALNINIPATYFILGKFVEKNAEFIGQLAKNNTVGSHAYSHNNLKELSHDQLYLELKLTKELLEKATGQAPTWFRAPFLEYNKDTLSILNELGFKYDSSGDEKWMQKEELIEVPISGEYGTNKIASDYDIFIKDKLSDEEALEWYKQRYLERKDTEKLLVLLFHPSIVVDHKEVLRQLITFIKEQGGQFITADQWAKKLDKVSARRVGVWIDFTVGIHDISQVITDLKSIGTTDAFLMVSDYDGQAYFSGTEEEKALFEGMHKALQQAGIKVHAWLSVLFDPKNAQLSPEIAMIDNGGKISLEWLSPSNPRTKFLTLDTISALLDKYDFDGIHLDYIRYPSLAFDFSDGSVNSFIEETGLQNIEKADLLSKHYVAWVDWQTKQITELVGSIHELVNTTFDYKNLELSAALIADASLSYSSREKFGQNYSHLAKYLDLIIPMAYFKDERKPVGWISDVIASTRYHIGNTELMVGLASYQESDKWKITNKEFKRSVQHASKGSDGIVFYNYLNLFGKGEKSWNMDAQNVDFLHQYFSVNEQVSSPEAATNSIISSKILILGQLAIGVILVVVWIVIRKRNFHGLDVSSAEERKLDVDFSKIDFDALEKKIHHQGNISSETFNEVSAALKGIGPQNISRFRRMKLLGILEDGPISLIKVQKTLSGFHNDLAGLRRIEEAGMLGYLIIDGEGMISITDLGVKLFVQSTADGYSSSLINFIDRDLSPSLVPPLG